MGTGDIEYDSNKVYDHQDSTAGDIEIPTTAHQISSGSLYIVTIVFHF